LPTAFITGANRGIGLEHVRQYASQGWEVHATARKPASAGELQSLAAAYGVHIHELDVTDHDGVEQLASRLQGTAIDVLVNNAGTFGPLGAPEGLAYQSLDNMDYAIWRDILEVNLLAPFKVATALHAHVSCSVLKLHVLMSSGLASIALSEGSSYAYRTSKAGVNMMAKGMGAEWRDMITIAMAPGWCKTDLGGRDAPIETAASVKDQQALFSTLTLADSGSFIDAQGESLPW